MKSKKKNEKYRKCADCIHEWACQAWNVGTIHEMDAGICANYEAVKDSTVYWLGYRAGQADEVYVLNKAVDLMAEYIVTLGRVDYHLCDLIPKEIHLKHQPKNDGNYDNEPCQKCVAEYFLKKAGEQE